MKWRYPALILLSRKREEAMLGCMKRMKRSAAYLAIVLDVSLIDITSLSLKRNYRQSVAWQSNPLRSVRGNMAEAFCGPQRQ
jgi:hypothetical protein